MILRSCLTGALAWLAGADALAQERWATAFNRGYATAFVTNRRGEALRLSCDTNGRRPGKGSILVELRVPKTAFAAAPPRAEAAASAGGRAVRFSANLTKAPARDTTPAPQRRAGRGAALAETREGAAEEILTLAHDLDGSATGAEPMAALAAAIAREPKEIALKIAALGLEAKFGAVQAARAIRGFDKGCQDALPAADDELQWDWHQGLDRIEERIHVTLATAAEAQGPDGPKLMLRCAAGPLRVALVGPAPVGGILDDRRIAASVATDLEEGPKSIWRGLADPGGDAWAIEGDDAARFIASIWRGAQLKIASSRPGVETAPLVFPIAGAQLAARKLMEACPTPLLPPS